MLERQSAKGRESSGRKRCRKAAYIAEAGSSSILFTFLHFFFYCSSVVFISPPCLIICPIHYSPLTIMGCYWLCYFFWLLLRLFLILLLLPLSPRHWRHIVSSSRPRPPSSVTRYCPSILLRYMPRRREQVTVIASSSLVTLLAQVTPSSGFRPSLADPSPHWFAMFMSAVIVVRLLLDMREA